ncbi:SRPBCC family protein [Algoriphagus chordae]|uniref:Uncharacterized protein YndB with AHSA1/START domain n=1 Tax=Algoriphagus chordae TaxID=237019 RepID=A0A2W7RTG2_9BACT|nr:SRPBCC domain-containing protein [Algoriphagus chordae]PZX57849.1 uncharacterized protein YndB with AHSA1/START domain [Algoriphagus chordae]
METTPNDNFAIYHRLIISASVGEVFEAISEPKHLINWWPLSCTGKPELNAQYNFYFGESYNWFGRVSKIDSNTTFHVKMTKADPDWDPTTFGFDLETSGTNVTVNFSHSGWPACNEHFKVASYCWAILLHSLKNYLEKGIIIPFEERE